MESAAAFGSIFTAAPMIFSRRRRHKKDRRRRRSAAANHLQEVKEHYMVVIHKANTTVTPSIIHALTERLRRYEIASFVCLAVKITQEVTDMPNIHFHHSC